MRGTTLWCTFALALFLAAGSALAQSSYEQINRMRAEPTCAPGGVAEGLRRNAALERAAALLASGSDLESSLKQAGYRASRCSVAHMASNVAPDELIRMFAERNCALIAERGFTDVGVHLQAGAITALLAEPFSPKVGFSQEEAGMTVLDLVNRARAQARTCEIGRAHV